MSDEIQSRSQRRKQQEQARKSGQKNSKKPTGKKKQPIWKRILKIVAILAVIGLVFGAGLFTFYAATAPELDEESLKDPLSSELYAEGATEPFLTLGAENRQYVEFEQIPQVMEDAVLATEDVRFYKHHGMDLWRLGGAVLANFRDGFGAQGASTISQQVVKNSFLQNEKTLKRKAQEAWLAFQLERKYEKEEIFEMYFNKVLMTDNIYGFGTAADEFYGKEPEELELHEAALLAGMPQSPNRYNPYRHPERAEKRRNTVLGLMVQHGKITQEEADAAKAIPATEGLIPLEERKPHGDNQYSAFVDVIKDELEKHDLSIADGLKIYTTLDPAAQEQVEQTIARENMPTEKLMAGVAVVDTKTGAVRALGGSPDYVPTGSHYGIMNGKKQDLGSTVKPLLVYGPAIEYEDWSTGQTVNDERRTYKGSDQVIRNANGRYLGEMTMRKALYMSQNVPAVSTFEEVGGKKSADFARGLGIDVKEPHASTALGGGVGSSPLELAGAYAAFGNGGMYTEPYMINKVVMRDGKTERDLRPKPVSAMKDSTAYMITDVLRDVVDNPQGTAYRYVKSHGLDVAGKTGTTNYDAKTYEEKYSQYDMAVPDSWFVGYTPEYSIAVWSGHENKEPMTTWDERSFPQVAFSNILGDLSQRGKHTSFKKPKSVVEATIEIGSDPLKLASEWTPSNLKSTELFVRGTVPKRVSETYEPEEEETLAAPTGLRADYDEAQNLVNLSWDHEGSENVEFAVTYSVDGGSAQNLTTTTEKTAAATGVEPGATYTFSVVAKSGDLTSPPATVSLQLGESPEEQPEEPDENEQEPDENEQEPGENEGGPDENGQEPGDNGGNGENGGDNGNSGNQNPDQGDGTGNPGDGSGNQGGNQGGGQGGGNPGGGQGGQTDPGNGDGTGEGDQNP